MKKAALYVRVSTTEQAQEGYSIKAQTEKLTKFAEAKDYTIVKIYTDAGHSGAKLERPALQQMLKDIANNLIDIVVVYKLDRLSRSQKNTLYLIEDVFLKNDVEFISMQESFDTSTPFGRAMIGILSTFAQLERDTITERMQMGLTERVKNGYYRGTSERFVPVGYKYIDNFLKVNEYEAMAVKEAFDLFLIGLSLHEICSKINKKYSLDKLTSPTSVRYVLSNRTYIGEVGYQKQWYPGKHEAIIDIDTFNKVQKKLNERSEKNNKAFNYTTLLAGISYCENCGARYYGVKRKLVTKTDNRYKCYSRQKNKMHMVKDPNCKNMDHNMEEADESVISFVKKFDLGDFYKNKQNKDEVNKTKVIMEKLNDIDSKISKLLTLYQNDAIPENMLTKQINDLTKERDIVSSSLELESTKEMISETEAKKIIKTIKDFDWLNSSLSDKRLLIDTIVDKVIFSDDGIKIVPKY